MAKKVTAFNHLPGYDDDRFVVFSKQFNELIDVYNLLQPTPGTLAADIVQEYTAGSGVTIDGFLIQDGLLLGTVTVPAVTGTVGILEEDQTWTGINTFSNATPIKTDVVGERTLNNGVNVDGVLLKDGTVRISGIQVLKAQQLAEVDPGAITNYTAHASGGVAVTSNAATDLDTTAAALALLENEVTALRASYISLLAKLRTHGMIAT